MHFDLATYLESQEQKAAIVEDDSIFDDEGEHDPDIGFGVPPLGPHAQLAWLPVKYFDIADSLACGCIPCAPKPCTFLTPTTAFHIATSLHLSINEAATLFGIPDLCPVIEEFLRCFQDNPSLHVGTHNPQVPLTFELIQVWYKIHIQQPLYHGKGKVEALQTLRAVPPSSSHPHGLYDAVIASPDLKSDWPLCGIKGTAIVSHSAPCANLSMEDHSVVQL